MTAETIAKVLDSRHARGRRHRGGGLPTHHTIKAVAEALDVSSRTVRRWIANGDLVVHRVGGVVRVGADDFTGVSSPTSRRLIVVHMSSELSCYVNAIYNIGYSSIS